jgi:hypothetical protein
MPPISLLQSLIRTQGPIPFATFMGEALYGEGGYYSREESPSAKDGPRDRRLALTPVRMGDRPVARPTDQAMGSRRRCLRRGSGPGSISRTQSLPRAQRRSGT